jgi:fatty acid desaturase
VGAFTLPNIGVAFRREWTFLAGCGKLAKAAMALAFVTGHDFSHAAKIA